MYATCTVYVVFFAFLLNADDHWTVDLLIASLSVVLGLVTLLGLFAQKMFIVIFVKEVQIGDDSGASNFSSKSEQTSEHRKGEEKGVSEHEHGENG